jgi:hypothetical protein
MSISTPRVKPVPGMNLKRLLVILAAGVLCLGVFSPAALAGKRKETTVVTGLDVVLTGQQNVKVTGHLKSSLDRPPGKPGRRPASKCQIARAMKLLWTDANGVVLGTLDRSTSDMDGNWRLQGKLPAPPTANDRLKVKANKRTVGKIVCLADFSPLITIS